MIPFAVFPSPKTAAKVRDGANPSERNVCWKLNLEMIVLDNVKLKTTLIASQHKRHNAKPYPKKTQINTKV